MDELAKSLFFRSMSITEYNKWKNSGEIDRGQDWTETRISDSHRGYSLIDLKEWVDNNKNEWGPHDVIIQVSGKNNLEFSLATRNEHFNHSGESEDYMLPLRYKNLLPICFQRTSLIYDPRALVSITPTLILNKSLKKEHITSILGIRIRTLFFSYLKS